MWKTVSVGFVAISVFIGLLILGFPARGEAKIIDGKGVTQADAGWNLSVALGVNNMFSSDYWYPVSAGSGASIYVVDSGVSEEGFNEGAVANGYNVVNDDVSGSAKNDCLGHGSKVASVVGSEKYGLAKHATIVPVKVSECEEAYSQDNIIEGLEWIKNNPPVNGSTGIGGFIPTL